MADYIRFLRFIPVVALLGIAAALLTDKGKLPLALRGLKKMLRQDIGERECKDKYNHLHGVSPLRRLLAFVLILLAFLIVVWPL